MTLDEYLDEKKALCDRIKYKEARIRFFQSKTTSCTMTYGERIGSTPSPSLHPTEDALVEIMDLETEVDLIKAELSALNDRFRNSIHRIGNLNLEMVLEMKYIDGATWDEIKYAMHYSRTQLHRFLSQGLDALSGADSS